MQPAGTKPGAGLIVEYDNLPLRGGWCASFAGWLFLGKLQRKRVDAMPLSGGCGPVVKYVPQVGAAPIAQHFGAFQEMTGILSELHTIG